jgi:HEAT repeat protein
MVTEVKPKGATEGFETRLVWSSAVAKADGVVINIKENSLQYRKHESGRVVTLSLRKAGHELKPLVKVGTEVIENQILASVVPVLREIPCNENLTQDYYIRLIKSVSHSDRYVAAKALAYYPSLDTISVLKERIEDKKEHIYIRLECACGLLRLGEKNSIQFFEEMLDSEYLEYQLECVIALSEVGKEESTELLIKTLLNADKNAEIRAGAAWSLGEMRSKSAITALSLAFDAIDNEVKIEAARAMVKLNEFYSNEVIKLLPESSDARKAGISWALSKSGNFTIHDLLEVMKDEDARKWIAWIIGTQKEQKCISQIEELKNKDREVYFAVTVLWKVLSSWINGLEIY